MIPRQPLNSGKLRLLVGGLAVLVLLGAFGLLRGCTGVSVESDEAVDIARPHIDFEPTKTDVRLLRQGFGLRPVWVVNFSIPDADDPSEFDRLTRVIVDGASGEIRSVSDETAQPEDDGG